MNKKALVVSLILFLSLCFSNMIFAENKVSVNLNEYQNLYNEGKYTELINILETQLSGKEKWYYGENDPRNIPESVYIQVRNLLGDSYRMVEKYYKAEKIYASTYDGWFDSYALYCSVIFDLTSDFKYNEIFQDNDGINYYSIFDSTPSHEEILVRILKQLLDKTSLSNKHEYFSDLNKNVRNNDWVTQLVKFYAGTLTLDKLISTTPREVVDIVYTFAGLNFEISGNKSKARELYYDALAEENSNNIEMLLAAARLGLFATKRIYTIPGPAGNESTKLTNIYSIKVSSAKYEVNRLYSAQNLIDNIPITTWVPDSKKSGIGDWLEFSFDDPVPVKSLTITNGYAKSDTVFKNNNRIKIATLEFSDGSQQKITLKDTMKPQTIQIGKKTQKVRLTINEVYKGIKYDDTCLSEMGIKFEAPDSGK